jgi:hypothetical protein
MKASTPSLLLFGITSIAAVVFKLFHFEILTLFAKSIIVPSLFIYYLVSNNYKVSLLNSIMFILFFARDVFNMLNIQETAMGSFLCVLIVYLLLLYFAQKEIKLLKFNYKDSFFLTVLILTMSVICYSVLSLNLENLELNFYLYVVFGIILSVLTIISVANYNKTGSYTFFNGMMMCLCFVVTDIFFVMYKFYFYHDIMMLISIITQFLSYFFMANYFIEKDKVVEDLYNN